MNWEKIKQDIYYLDGSLRDIFVTNTKKDNWLQWAEYVNKNYNLEWYNGNTQTTVDKIDFSIVLEYWNGNTDLYSTAKIFIGNIQINSHFFDDEEFENDISPKEFDNIQDHNLLVKYMSDLSKLFEKTIYLTPENEHDIKLFEVKGDDVKYAI
ncbi:MAG TPA: hypothetical protein VHA56_09810 [Mucilaginibacter sp.]|nr:hypothetical protein [Mucilaginibacter sp.]